MPNPVCPEQRSSAESDVARARRVSRGARAKQQASLRCVAPPAPARAPPLTRPRSARRCRSRKASLEARLERAALRHRAAVEAVRSAAGMANMRVDEVAARQKRRFEPPTPPRRGVRAAAALSLSPDGRSPPRTRARTAAHDGLAVAFGVPFGGGPDDGFSLDGGTAVSSGAQAPSSGDSTLMVDTDDELLGPPVRRSYSDTTLSVVGKSVTCDGPPIRRSSSASSMEVARAVWSSLSLAEHEADDEHAESDGSESSGDSSDGEPEPPLRQRRLGAVTVHPDSSTLMKSAVSPKRAPAEIWAVMQAKLSAAADARERLLEARTTSNAERSAERSTRRAALETSLEEAAEVGRRRIEAGLAEAEERRAAKLNHVVKRVQAHTASVEQRRTRVGAARAIQRRWRRRSSGSLEDVAGAAATGVGSDADVHAPFERVRRMFAGRKLGAALTEVHRILRLKEPAEDIADESGTADALGDFERVARAIQAPEALVAARTLTAGLAFTCEKVLLDPPLPDPTESEAAVRASEGGAPPGPPALAKVACSARTLLAATLIAWFPNEMLPDYDSDADDADADAAEDAEEEEGTIARRTPDLSGDADFRASAERELVEAARDLVTSLEVLASAPKRKADGGSAAQVVAFARRTRAVWSRYQAAFVAWKRMDGARLAQQIRPAMVDIELERRRVVAKNRARAASGGSPADSQILAGLRLHFAQLTRQVGNMVGPDAAQEILDGVYDEVDRRLADEPASVDASSAPSGSDGGSDTASTAPDGDGRRSPSPGEELRGAAPVGVQKSLAAQRSALSNEVLVHRLCMDPEWRLPVPAAAPGIDWDTEVAPAEADTPVHSALARTEADGDVFAEGDAAARAARRNPSFWLGMLRRRGGEAAGAVVRDALNSVKAGIAAVVPHRSDVAAAVATAIDGEHIGRQVATGVLSARSLAALTAWLAEQIAALEAPARVEDTRRWSEAAESALAALGDGDAPESALARVLAWCFFKLDVLRADAANFHLSTLAPYLTRGRKGAEYERRQFEAKLRAGSTQLIGTASWLRGVVQQLAEEAEAAATGAGDRLRAGLGLDDASTRRFLVAEGVLSLVQRPVALTLDAAAGALAHAMSRRAGVQVSIGVRRAEDDGDAGGAGARDAEEDTVRLPRSFPETLRLDVNALTEMQNTLQRLALNSLICATIGQVISERVRAGDAEPAVDSVRSRAVASVVDLHKAVDVALMRDDATRESIASSVVLAAESLAAHMRGVALREADRDVIRRTIAVGADTEHALFSLFFRRTVSVLRFELRRDALRALHARSPALEAARATAPKREPSRVPGLSWAVPILSRVARDVLRIVDHSEAVFGPHYGVILAEIAKGAAPGDAAAAALGVAEKAEEEANADIVAAGARTDAGVVAATGGAGRAASASPPGDGGDTNDSDDEL